MLPPFERTPCALGDPLIVGVHPDASVRHQGKGDECPINRPEGRMALLAALESLSPVTWFDAETPLEFEHAARPDVLLKGGDWRSGNIIGAAEVTGWGGSVHSNPFQHHTSTTDLLGRIRA